MRTTLVGCVVVLATLVSSALFAQQPPNFTGRWIPAGDSSQPAQPLVVQQTATSLSVENWSSSGPRPGVYAWSTGSASITSVTPTLSWSGTTLVVVFPPGEFPELPGAVTVRTESWSLDTSGQLTVAIDLARESGPRIVRRIVYRRPTGR